MLKLLIVEDETATRNGLINHLDWIGMGISELSAAKDGLEGLSEAKRFRPDIVICDIRMPGISGIDLTNSVVELLPQCQIIFISGYSDKEYLKAAIRYGVIRYIEKPLDLDELREAVVLAVKKCMEWRKGHSEETTQEELIRRALRGEPTATDVIKRRLEASGGHTPAVVLLFSSSYSREYAEELLRAVQQALRKHQRICSIFDDKCIAVVSDVGPSQLKHFAFTMFNSTKNICGPQVQIFCSVGQCVDDLSQLETSYITAAEAFDLLFFRGYGHIVFSVNDTHTPCDLGAFSVNTFIQLLQEGKWDEIHAFIDTLCTQMKKQTIACVAQVKDLFMQYSFALLQEAERRSIRIEQTNTEDSSLFWNVLSGAPTLDALRILFLQQIDQVKKAFLEAEDSNLIISQVLKIIQEEYGNPALSVNMLSDHVYLTQPYLSFLFKKVMRKTTTEYIAWFRIEKAKELLRSNHAKLWEVAKHVGYSDANYFTKSFKRLTGMTPSKYRERYHI